MKFVTTFLLLTICVLFPFVSALDSRHLPKGMKKEDFNVLPLFGSKPYIPRSVKAPVTGQKSTVRAPGSYFQGVFLLCEGSYPNYKVLDSRNRYTSYQVVYSHGCLVFNVYGSLSGGRRYENHANVWAKGAFTGLDYIREWALACQDRGTEYIGIQKTVNGHEKEIAWCSNSFEAHAFAFKI